MELKNKRKELIILVLSILVVILSVSVAYFTSAVFGDKKKINLSSKTTTDIVFDNGSAIEGDDIDPGWSTTSTFSITNNSQATYKYNIVIEDLINTFLSDNYLQYKITSTNNGYSMEDYESVPKSSKAQDVVLAYSVSIEKGVTQSYTIEFRYINDPDVDQSKDIGKTLSGNIFITPATGYLTLYEKMLEDNPTITNRASFSALTEDTTGSLYTALEANVHNTTAQTVYFYAGSTTNNWVKFGKYPSDWYSCYDSDKNYTHSSTEVEGNTCEKIASKGDDIYWKIIRTNADGSVRLLYHGTSTKSSMAYIGKSKFNDAHDEPMYAGYMYGTTGSYETAFTNTTDSAIKSTIDNWYSNNFTSYTSYLSTTAVYCNDKYNEYYLNYNYENRSINFNWEYYNRNSNPSYNCTTASDAFSGSNTSAKLTYPIGLMTADEIKYSGGNIGTTISSPYIYYYTNSTGGSSTGQENWWLLTPNNFYVYSYYNSTTKTTTYTSHQVYLTQVSGSKNPAIFGTTGATTINAVRPVIAIKSDVQVAQGNGASSSPYQLIL